LKRLPAALALLAALLPALAAAADIAAAPTSFQVLFTPWDDAEGALVRAVDGARRQIYVQAYLLTSRPLARALIAAHRRGVTVEVLADREMTSKADGGSRVPMLASAGIPVSVEVRYAAAHNKIILIDPEDAGNAVITGSYNFTFAAQARNAENLLIVRGNSELARRYLDNWRRHRAEAEPLAAAAGPTER
jgi:phosphatidylserine/phosphatidylglycerophosphate/cardiolipin synthase-like enzyme